MPSPDTSGMVAGCRNARHHTEGPDSLGSGPSPCSGHRRIREDSRASLRLGHEANSIRCALSQEVLPPRSWTK